MLNLKDVKQVKALPWCKVGFDRTTKMYMYKHTRAIKLKVWCLPLLENLSFEQSNIKESVASQYSLFYGVTCQGLLRLTACHPLGIYFVGGYINMWCAVSVVVMPFGRTQVMICDFSDPSVGRNEDKPPTFSRNGRPVGSKSGLSAEIWSEISTLPRVNTRKPKEMGRGQRNVNSKLIAVRKPANPLPC